MPKRKIIKIHNKVIKPYFDTDKNKFKKIGTSQRTPPTPVNNFIKSNYMLKHTIDIKKYHINPNFAEFKKKKFAIFLHLYYEHYVNEILSYINRSGLSFDIFITIPKNSQLDKSPNKNLILNSIKNSVSNVSQYEIVNKGKDIGGKLFLIHKNINSDYDYVIFMHDKKSPQMKEDLANKWRISLYESILGINNLHKISLAFSNNSIKMCGGLVREGFIKSRAIAVNIGNTKYINDILLSILNIKNVNDGAFIGGTMFWVDWNFYKNFWKDIDIHKIISILEEGNVQEPSYAHAMERIFGIVVTSKGYKIGSL